MSEVAYRRDIDGLRAIAVLAVVAFHADVHAFSGGYVGVDIFFVISGFLIGSALLKEFAGGSFSIAAFYKRRVLRIAPALFALFAALLVVSPLVLFPDGLAAFSASMRAALLSVSNFYFQAHTNYFSDPFGEPLLHTWSLAVEEQFYLVLPLLLFGLRKASDRMRIAVLLFIFACSAAASVLLVHTDQNAAFYSPVSRCWELLTGVLIFYLLPMREKMPHWMREALLFTGLVLLLWSIHFYSSKTHFPGLAATVPCAGAGLIILCGGPDKNSAVTRLLSWSPVVFVGLISYSLYLWHWPVIVFLKMGAVPHLPYHHRSQTILIFSASLVLATLSWKYIETPFRSRSMRAMPSARVLMTFAATCVAVLVVSVAVTRLPSPFPTEALAMSKYVDQVDNEGYRKGLCYVGDPYSFADFNRSACLTLDPTRPNVLVLGDSHAAADYPGLRQAFPDVNFLQATNQGCKPVRGPGYSADCDKLMRFIFNEFLPAHHVTSVLLIGRWLEMPEVASLDGTIAYLRSIGQTPVIVGPAPEYQMSLPRLIANSLKRKDPSLPVRYQAEEQFALDAAFRAHAAALNVAYVSPVSLLCPERKCIDLVSYSPRVPLLFDSNHFTVEGSVLFAEKLRLTDPQLLAGSGPSQVSSSGRTAR